MRKLLLLAVTAAAFLTVRAGGLMTNTNYHIAFDRMMARGATFDIDATFSNLPVWHGGTKDGNSRSTSRNRGNIATSNSVRLLMKARHRRPSFQPCSLRIRKIALPCLP